jgi:hypothetical protein
MYVVYNSAETGVLVLDTKWGTTVEDECVYLLMIKDVHWWSKAVDVVGCIAQMW